VRYTPRRDPTDAPTAPSRYVENAVQLICHRREAGSLNFARRAGELSPFALRASLGGDNDQNAQIRVSDRRRRGWNLRLGLPFAEGAEWG
jgi:hypothetical protein